MGRCSTENFREKEVVNVADGRKLGYVGELEFDVCDGRITAIVIPGKAGFCGLGAKESIVIPWEKIERIGEDVILVNATSLLPPLGGGCREKWKSWRGNC